MILVNLVTTGGVVVRGTLVELTPEIVRMNPSVYVRPNGQHIYASSPEDRFDITDIVDIKVTKTN